MKKKILFGLGTLAIAVVLTFNVSIAKNSNNSGLELNILVSKALAYTGCGSGGECSASATCNNGTRDTGSVSCTGTICSSGWGWVECDGKKSECVYS